MKSLFDSAGAQEMIGRINKLSTDARAGWGRMTVDQMLVHAQRPMQVAFDELKLKRSFIGILFGGIAKKKLTRPEPWKKNMPTDPHFVVKEHYNVDDEKKNLITLVQRFVQSGPSGITQKPHPFFGEMTTREWDALMWNHLDHHLRQFGA